MKIKCKKCGEEFSMTKKELFPPKPVNSNNQAIVDMIEIFAQINPAIPYGHRGYRNDAEALIKAIGAEKALEAARVAVKVQGAQFAPQISTPTALRHKLGDLMSYYKRTVMGRTVEI